MLTYRNLRDDLVKYAVDQPRAVVVEVDDLTVATDSLLTAFSSAWMCIDTWPTVPLLVVAESPAQRGRLRSSVVDRFVPVFDTQAAAVASLAAQPTRRRAMLRLARNLSGGRRARRFVNVTCERWGVPRLRADAGLVATELVENSLVHADSADDIELRLELRKGRLTVAVSDSDPREAVLREPGADAQGAGGLHVVARLARAWGCAPRWPAGKVVWVTLPMAAVRLTR
ncbi:ATP-binding protein [Nocardia blacklockiae]|uniref:ATP-binding protein n=1 Tax=Nocardia blacklockiae TaxID=480036 RepID=UPI0018953ABF|nr:ATP-binding protein [Nocardia blacklockiae]MBF6170674.1 ATP-binding protein [Nocardia blacklockiae]